jgi:oligoribonuclease (3'-5' exoribonuclease)
MDLATEHRLKVLEQKLQVMQKEVSEVLGEMQQAITSLMRAQALATAVTNSRLTEVEKLLLEVPAEPVEPTQGGKEI